MRRASRKARSASTKRVWSKRRLPRASSALASSSWARRLVSSSRVGAQEREGLHGEAVGAREVAESEVGAPDGRHQAATHVGPVEAVEVACSSVQELPCGDLLPFRFAGRGAPEEAAQEVQRLLGFGQFAFGPAGLHLGAVALGGGHLCLPQRGAEADHQREHHRRRGAREGAVALHELAQAVGRRPLARLHGLPGEVAREVVGQGLGRGVALGRLRAQGLQADRVQVAAQVAAGGGRAGAGRAAAGGRRAHARRGAIRERVEPPRGQRGVRAGVVRTRARQQFVEQHAERVHVRRRRNRVARDLLGGGVGGRHHLRAGGRAEGGLRHEPGVAVRVVVGGEELGDAEVEELHARTGRRAAAECAACRRAAFGREVARLGGGDEDVRGLEVAVHHEALMRVLHGAARLQKQAQPLAQPQGVLIAEARQRLALDVLHREVGHVAEACACGGLVGDARVQKLRDARVLKPREDLAL